MARIRSIKPGYATSEAIANLSIGCELHFVKLWTYCDDHGRGMDNPRLIKAAIWPLRDEVTLKQVVAWQDELEEHGRIVRYTVNGKQLFQVENWTEHQKPQHPKESEYPSPESPVVDSKPQEDFSKPQEASPETTLGVVVGEGEGVVDVDGGILPDAFEDFWNTYPRHHQNGKPGGGASKSKTADRWKKLSERDRALCLTAVVHYAEAISHPNAPFPAHASTWLNEKRWLDWLEPADYSQARGPAPPRDRFAEMAERFQQGEAVTNGQADRIIDATGRGLPAGQRS